MGINHVDAHHAEIVNKLVANGESKMSGQCLTDAAEISTLGCLRKDGTHQILQQQKRHYGMVTIQSLGQHAKWFAVTICLMYC